jgi:2-iminobutanoate/2-iminopropanoate deaminase
MKTSVNSTDAPKVVGPYSQAIVSGDFIYTSGQIHVTNEGTLLEGSIEDQTHQVMKNLAAVLKAAGVDFSNVVKTTIYVTDMSTYSSVNTVYASYFAEPFPARETVCVKELPSGAKVEISLVASKQ